MDLGALLTDTQRVMLDQLDDRIRALASNSNLKLQRGETLVLNSHKVPHRRPALASDSNRGKEFALIVIDTKIITPKSQTKLQSNTLLLGWYFSSSQFHQHA